MPLLSLVRCVLGVLHLVAKLQQGIFKIVKPVRWRSAVARWANRWHFGGRKRMRMGIEMEIETEMKMWDGEGEGEGKIWVLLGIYILSGVRSIHVVLTQIPCDSDYLIRSNSSNSDLAMAKSSLVRVYGVCECRWLNCPTLLPVGQSRSVAVWQSFFCTHVVAQVLTTNLH